MKTEDLINLIAEDNRRPVNLPLSLAAAVAGGATLAAAAFFLTIGFRHDIGQALETIRFPFKFVVTISLCISAGALLTTVVRPDSPSTYRPAFLLVPVALLFGAVIVEMFVTPPDTWSATLIGRNALHCLTIIPVLSLFPAVPLFVTMRLGAPKNAGGAGVVAALVSAGIAATLYASNCFDDSPLFVATWYSIATAIVATMGYFAGRRFLSW